MSASYVVGATTAKDGATMPHPDQPSGSGVNTIATVNAARGTAYTTMAQIHATMGSQSFQEVLADTDSVLVRTGKTYIISYFRSF